MNDDQSRAILDLCTGRLSTPEFLKACGIAEAEVPGQVDRLLRQAIVDHDGEGVEFALMLGSSFSVPSDILDLVHNLILQDWHTRHEDMVGLLQEKASAASVPVLQQAIALKPSLEYLDYDDYGSYYRKCLWALQAIGTPEAISAIGDCTASEDAVLQEQADYRLDKIRNQRNEETS